MAYGHGLIGTKKARLHAAGLSMRKVLEVVGAKRRAGHVDGGGGFSEGNKASWLMERSR